MLAKVLPLCLFAVDWQPAKNDNNDTSTKVKLENIKWAKTWKRNCLYLLVCAGWSSKEILIWNSKEKSANNGCYKYKQILLHQFSNDTCHTLTERKSPENTHAQRHPMNESVWNEEIKSVPLLVFPDLCSMFNFFRMLI